MKHILTVIEDEAVKLLALAGSIADAANGGHLSGSTRTDAVVATVSAVSTLLSVKGSVDWHAWLKSAQAEAPAK